MNIKSSASLLGILSLSALLGACSDDNDPAPMLSYEVTVQNLSENQPLSPVAAQLHTENYRGWNLGSPASDGLELLAEGGDNSTFLATQTHVVSSQSGTGIIVPGGSESLTLVSMGSAGLQLTVATMLVNSNDAFAGTTGTDISSLATGESLSLNLPLYDAGTEMNDELAAHIPGPAGNGEGFAAARNDVDYVAMHPGFVSADDGYAESALNASHKVDAPVARLTITRLQ